MEPTHETPSPQSQAADAGELIVLNGRQSGARKALHGSITLIGRAAGCDIRLQSEDVSLLHCLIVQGPEGFVVRDLGSPDGTLVNGELIAGATPVHDNDTLTIGPFRFQVRLPRGSSGAATKQFLLREADLLAKEKEALRIQAAAVVAQQAALTESEAKLAQRRGELQRQEEQLAGHLEEKRAKLLELQNQVREAHNALQKERDEHEAFQKTSQGELDQARKEVTALRQQGEKEKRRLTELRKRLQRRFHEHWDREQEALRKRGEELTGQKRELEKATAQLRQDRTGLVQARLRFNGEVEVGRRQLQSNWNDLQQQRRLWQEQRARELAELQQRKKELDRRATALTDAEYHLADEQLRWQDTRYLLEKELAGLNIRCRNQRRKVLDLDQEIQRLETGADKRVRTDGGATTPTQVEIIDVLPPAVGSGQQADAPVPGPTTAVVSASRSLSPVPAVLPEGRVAGLERLTTDLVEQRIHLAQQCERVLWAHQHWLEDQAVVVQELERFGVRLSEKERELQSRLQAAEEAECEVRRHRDAAAQVRNHLEGWQARLSARETAWRGERERLLAQLKSREDLVQKQLGALGELRRRWSERRREETKRLQAEHDNCLNYRQQYITLWEEYFRKSAALEREQRALAERTLAMEQYRLEVLGQDSNSVAVERRLERLRRRWEALSEAVASQLADERKAIEAEMTRLHEYARSVRDHALGVTKQEEELSLRQADWEQERQVAEVTQAKLRQELQAMQVEREQYERHLHEQREELERLARSLLEEEVVLATPAKQAA